MYIMIINKVAGNGRGLRVFEEVKSSPLYQKHDCRAFYTEYAGHAEKLAEQLASLHGDRIETMVVIGGDGTMHEVLNGLSNYSMVPVAFIPAGTGNDFSKGYQINGSPLQILENIMVTKRKRQFYPGTYVVNQRTSKARRVFANSIGFGFDAEIVEENNKSKYKGWLSHLKLGWFSYVVSLLKVLKNFTPKTIEVTIDGDKQRLDDVWMVTVTNHPYYGGGMKIAPNTTVQGSSFPLLIMREIPAWKVLLFFLTVFIGKHIHFKEVSIYDVTAVEIIAQNPIYYQVDGQAGTCKSCQISKNASKRVLFGGNSKKIS
ncbi:diacylglycerol/lipid kinase family protein [Aquibacillus sediminis]|uniref:diacylglycerol/lipid kinase family protein n=1 Tax=Aquibacillus sediminis TaxID=2574734 RepID=UPI001109D6A3|nr:diacylglycerol kinase family protein [Aquibacillus sediminis]